MTTRRKLIFTAAILLPVAALAVVSLRPRLAPAAPAMTSAAPADSVHELASLEQQLKQNPNHVPILLRMAELNAKAGKTPQTLVLLRQAAAADPNNGEVQLELGRALYEANDPQGAIEATKRILKFDKNNVDALYNLGAIYGNISDTANARLYFARAAEAGPTTDSGRKAKSALDHLN